MRIGTLKRSRRSAAGRSERIEELMRRCDELSGGAALHWQSDDCPPEVFEEFLERVVAFEQAPRSSLFEKLSREGCLAPSPDSLSDEALPAKIQEIAKALAKQGFYLDRTDHLSDRELYSALWEETLQDEFEDVAEGESFWLLDMAGSGSEEDLKVHLRYYAKEAERREWMKEFPDFPAPEPKRLPFDRDRLLPKPSRRP